MIRNALQAISGWGKEVVDFGVAVIMEIGRASCRERV